MLSSFLEVLLSLSLSLSLSFLPSFLCNVPECYIRIDETRWSAVMNLHSTGLKLRGTAFTTTPRHELNQLSSAPRLLGRSSHNKSRNLLYLRHIVECVTEHGACK